MPVEICFLMFLTILSLRVHRNSPKSAMTIILTNIDFTKRMAHCKVWGRSAVSCAKCLNRSRCCLGGALRWVQVIQICEVEGQFLGERTCPGTPFPQIDIIRAMTIVRRVRGKIIRSVLCNIMCKNCAQCNAHTHMNRPNSCLLVRISFSVVILCVTVYLF